MFHPTVPPPEPGVRPGDVILSIDEVPVAQVDNVAAQVGFRMPGSSIVLELWRWDPESMESRRITIDVVLGTMNPGVIYRESVRLLELLGLTELATLTPDLAAERGIPWVPGVLVLVSLRLVAQPIRQVKSSDLFPMSRFQAWRTSIPVFEPLAPAPGGPSPGRVAPLLLEIQASGRSDSKHPNTAALKRIDR